MSKIRLTTCGSYKFLTNTLDVYVGKSLEIYGEWSHGELTAISSLVPKNANIIEVGSNIGSHTVFIAKEICPEGNVYAFEPRRILFQNLCANLCINEISNVYTFQKALGLDFDIIFEGPIPQDGLLVSAGTGACRGTAADPFPFYSRGKAVRALRPTSRPGGDEFR